MIQEPSTCHAVNFYLNDLDQHTSQQLMFYAREILNCERRYNPKLQRFQRLRIGRCTAANGRKQKASNFAKRSATVSAEPILSAKPWCWIIPRRLWQQLHQPLYPSDLTKTLLLNACAPNDTVASECVRDRMQWQRSINHWPQDQQRLAFTTDTRQCEYMFLHVVASEKRWYFKKVRCKKSWTCTDTHATFLQDRMGLTISISLDLWYVCNVVTVFMFHWVFFETISARFGVELSVFFGSASLGHCRFQKNEFSASLHNEIQQDTFSHVRLKGTKEMFLFSVGNILFIYR